MGWSFTGWIQWSFPNLMILRFIYSTNLFFCVMEILEFGKERICLGLIFFANVLEILLLWVFHNWNKCICLSENIYMDSFILAEVLFNHNFIHLFLIVPHIMFHKAKEKKSNFYRHCALAFICIILKMTHLRGHLLLKVTGKYQMVFRAN